MYDWFPIVFIVFKVVVLGVGMFFAIKWHHDQAKKDAREKEERERAAAQKQTDDTGTPGDFTTSDTTLTVSGRGMVPADSSAAPASLRATVNETARRPVRTPPVTL